MHRALALAEEAARVGEVPVGAVIARGGTIVAEAHNAPREHHDPTAHAEIQAIRLAARKLGEERLTDCELWVTLEPCAMCAGALVHARIQRVVFAAWDPRVGAGGSIINLLDHPHMNHRCIVSTGLLGEQAEDMLKKFFVARRS